MAQVLTPVYEKQFHDHSYGFRPNKCIQQTVIAELDRVNDGYDWIVGIDLEKFFNAVSHDKLMTLVGKTIKDGEVIPIIRKFPVSGIKEDDEYRESIIGTRRGDNLSPLLANIMWDELDKEMEQRGLNFVRYADDCINMIGSGVSAKRVVRNTTRFIEEKLELKVNTTKSKVNKPQGIEYLGYGLYFDNRTHQYKAKPHAKSAAKFKARMKQLTCRSWGVSNIYKVQKLNGPIRGWVNYYEIGSMKTICARLDGSIRYRMRICIWKHRGTPQNRAGNLKRLGVPKWTAWWAAYAKGYARVCGASDVCEAVNNKGLTSSGLISMLDYYTERCVTY